jgi:hypothetical protein
VRQFFVSYTAEPAAVSVTRNCGAFRVPL